MSPILPMPGHSRMVIYQVINQCELEDSGLRDTVLMEQVSLISLKKQCFCRHRLKTKWYLLGIGQSVSRNKSHVFNFDPYSLGPNCRLLRVICNS